ncbi:MAG: hypothetical protein KDC51_08335, partial [Flavobacteriaceae bacterium]|nr:hypothetical protein [Flavobacteriaceae bacterium]
INQYQVEERSIMAKRMISFHDRIEELLDCMIDDTISTEGNIAQLKTEVYKYTNDMHFKSCTKMGEIVKTALEFVKRNYQDVSTKLL